MRLIIYFIFSIIVFCAHCNAAESPKADPKSGPFIARLRKIAKCEKTSRPYDKNPGIVYYIELYNTSKKQGLMRGNVSVLMKDNGKATLKLKNFIWEDAKWKQVYLFNKLDCNSQWFGTMLDIFGMKFENCSIPKGVYQFNGIDQNQIEHMWTSTKDYGRSLWRAETIYRSNILWNCWEFESEIIPA